MAFTITETRILDKHRERHPLGGITEMRTSIVGRLLTALPTLLLWDVDVDWTTDERSMVTCTASVRDDRGQQVASGEVTFAADPGSGEKTVSLPPFRVTVTGTYTVRVYVGDFCVESLEVLVSDSLS